MFRTCLLTVTLTGSIFAFGCAHDKHQKGGMHHDRPHASGGMNGNQMAVDQVVSNWPKGPRENADKLINKYGQPSGVTDSRLIWDNPGEPWHQIILYKETIDHQWPAPHQDYLEQSVVYSVPEDKFDELAEFDGSVIAERTRGTLAARCHTEWANLIALNLAHDIITDQKTVEQARQAYADAVKTKMSGGQTPPIASRLMFEPMSLDAARNPGQAVMKPKQN